MSRAVSNNRGSLRVYLEMIKVEHSVFALPFALLGMIYAAGGWPGWKVFVLIVLAMVSARSAGMAFNRIADREIDARNPRTAGRALQTGAISLQTAYLFFLISCGLFFLAAALLNRLTLILSPVALAILLFYSYTKRFTALSHLFLGLSLGIAPAGAWVAVSGELSWTPVLWIVGVMFWTAGFDILYSLQDEQVDREQGLKSIPARFGRRVAILASRVFHVLAFAGLIGGGLMAGAGPLYFFGCMFVGGLLIFEQALVKEDDLSRLDTAFFTMNGYVAIGMFFFSLMDVVIRSG